MERIEFYPNGWPFDQRVGIIPKQKKTQPADQNNPIELEASKEAETKKRVWKRTAKRGERKERRMR